MKSKKRSLPITLLKKYIFHIIAIEQFLVYDIILLQNVVNDNIQANT